MEGSLQELLRPSTEHCSARLHRTEGQNTLFRVYMDFQLAFTKEYRKNSLITKAHETTLVRKKNTSQELFKSPYTL